MKKIVWSLGLIASTLAGVFPTHADKEEQDDDWLGKAPKNRPVETNIPLRERSFCRGRSVIHVLKIDAPNHGCEPIFSEDGKFLYLLDIRGFLRKIETATLIERRRVSMAEPCAYLGMSGEGLLVSTKESPHMWVVDPDSLRVIRKHDLGRWHAPNRPATAPGVRYAWLGSVRTLPGKGPPGAQRLGRIDLKTGRLATIKVKPFFEKPMNRKMRVPSDCFVEIAATPDGDCLVSRGGDRGFCRFKIEGKTVELEQRIRHDRSGNSTLPMYRRGRFVFCPRGIQGTLGNTLPGRRGAYVHDLSQLDKPPLVLPAKDALDIDPESKRAFALEDNRLVGMDFQGRERWQAVLPLGYTQKKGKAIKRYDGLRLSPSGTHAIVIDRGLGVYWVELPKDLFEIQGPEGAPEPVALDEPAIAGDSHKTGGAAITRLTLSPTELTPNPVLTPDGKFLTVASPHGLVRRIDTATWRPLRQLDTRRPCVSLGRCSEGLVLLLRDPGAAWILDETTLEVIRRIPIADPGMLAAAPRSSSGFVIRKHSKIDDRSITRIDFGTGDLSRTMDLFPLLESMRRQDEDIRYTELREAGDPRLSQDGKYLVTSGRRISTRHRWLDEPPSTREALYRGRNQDVWLWNGRRLVLAGPTALPASSRLHGPGVSQDGIYSAYRTGSVAAVFWMRDFCKPVLFEELFHTACRGPGDAAVDSAGRRIYLRVADVLAVFGPRGERRKLLVLSGRPGEPETLLRGGYPRRLAKAPRGHACMTQSQDGSKLFVTTPYTCYWVAWPEPAAVPDAKPGEPWIGDEKLRQRMATKVAAAPVATNRPLAFETREVDGARIAEYALGNYLSPRSGGALIAAVFWSEQGGSIFLLRRDGLLRKISVGKRFREVRRLQLPQPCCDMVLCREGLVVAGAEYADLYVVDKDTLETRGKVSIPNHKIAQILGVAASEDVFVRIDRSERIGDVMVNLARISSKDRTSSWMRVRAHGHRKDPKHRLRFMTIREGVVMHPDGESIWKEDFGYLRRYEIDGDALVGRSVMPRLTKHNPNIAGETARVSKLRFSGDGRYLAFLAHDKIAGLPKFGYSATFIFKTDNPKRPLVTIEHDRVGGQVFFADEPRLLYEITGDMKLKVYKGSGRLVRQFDLAERPERTWRILAVSVPPHGRGLMVLTRKRLVHIRLPNDLFGERR